MAAHPLNWTATVFSAVFNGHSWFLFCAVLIALLLSSGAFSLASRHGTRPWEFSWLTALVVMEIAVTLAMPNGGHVSRSCVINREYFEPLHTQQGIYNLLMFIPIGLAGVIATRAVLPTVVSCTALSAFTELAQAIVPGVGRDCDSSDFTMNTAGAIIGAALACLILFKSKSGISLDRYWRHASYGIAAVAVAAGLIGAIFVNFLFVDSTSIQSASNAQEKVAQDAIRASFGDRYKLSKFQFLPPVDGGAGKDAGGSIAMLIDNGKANGNVTWSTNPKLTVSFENSDTVTSESFPISGVKNPPENENDAAHIATMYARQYHPESLERSHYTVTPVGFNAGLGWMVSWRRSNASGVLMPMQLDVEINRAGRISQMVSADIKDPANLPEIKIKKSQAIEEAESSVASDAHDMKNFSAGKASLAAKYRAGKWRIIYIIPFDAKDGSPTAETRYVDAATGETFTD